MNYVDFTILLIAVIGFLYGLIKGVIRQVGSLGGFIAGMVVARFFGGSFSALLREMFDLPEGVSRVIAYSLLFLIVYIICVHIIDPKGKLIPEKETASSQFYGYTLRVAPLLFSMAQEQFVSETKPTRGLFIPYSICNEPYLCCENCKAD